MKIKKGTRSIHSVSLAQLLTQGVQGQPFREVWHRRARPSEQDNNHMCVAAACAMPPCCGSKTAPRGLGGRIGGNQTSLPEDLLIHAFVW